MNRHPFYLAFRALATKSPVCRSCQRRLLYSSTSLRAVADGTKLSSGAKSAPPVRPFQHRLPETRGDNEYTAKPLGRPIGFPDPPRPGENSGIDTRTFSQRREDLVDHDKHREKRHRLEEKLYRPYFMDFRNMKFNRGKAWLGNTKIFKREAALFFPNFRGTTLLNRVKQDTTPLLAGKINVVCVLSSMWAQEQINTFVDPQQNPEIQDILDQYQDVAQRVDVNIEENYLKQLLLFAFRPNLRRQVPEDRHGKYFVVTKGVSDEIREAIGLINAKVGYVFLIDDECRIRWAACADASEEEKAVLARGLRKMAEERRDNVAATKMVTRSKAVKL